MSTARNLRRRRPAQPIRVDIAPPTGGPWQPLEGVRDFRFTVDEAPAPQTPAPLSPWQQAKLRQAMNEGLLLRRWAVRR